MRIIRIGCKQLGCMFSKFELNIFEKKCFVFQSFYNLQMFQLWFDLANI